MFLSIDVFQMISTILIVALLFLGFKVFETSWSYKISKPANWEKSLLKGNISKKLKKMERTYRDKVRLYNFWFQIERLKRLNIEGAFVEVGVYQGETAEMIHEMDSTRNLHLFDTFEGFDRKDLEKENFKDERYTTDNFSDTKLEEVKELFKDSTNVYFYKGYFPETAKDLREDRFSFVHLDADLYKPTIDALHYFYPKLSPGGVIIIHDYNHTWEGIRVAINEFIVTIPESLIEISDWQGSAMIIKNSTY